VVLGCKVMDENLRIGGVILNQVANIRQEMLIRAAVEKETGIPVLGAIPRMKGLPFAERHLGLLPPQEHTGTSEVLERLVEAVRENVDIDSLWELASSAPALADVPSEIDVPAPLRDAAPRIGVLRDSAFTFYYPENLDALERYGAQVIEISGLRDDALPAVDALYIGGGFPETHAGELARNESFRASLREEIENGLPVYAECGGLIYLGEAVKFLEETHPMTGVFPVTFTVEKKPQGHGYMVVEVDRPNPFFDSGTVLRGHEFHYARVLNYEPHEIEMSLKVKRGVGFDCGRDGLVYNNAFASFCHVHALGEKGWAKALVDAALRRVDEGSVPSAKDKKMRMQEKR
jgi:cobyrinic acid a,c-diamide synthase